MYTNILFAAFIQWKLFPIGGSDTHGHFHKGTGSLLGTGGQGCPEMAEMVVSPPVCQIIGQGEDKWHDLTNLQVIEE